MKKDPISVHEDDRVEEVVQAIEKYDLVALPVIDSIGRLVGRITIDDVMDEIREQHERDYQLHPVSLKMWRRQIMFSTNSGSPTLVADRHDRRIG